MLGTKDQTGTKAAEWIEGVRNGDQSLIDQFYFNYRADFLQWAEAKYKLGEDDLADIYQNAVIALYENVVTGKLENLQSNLKTYLYGIAKNLILKSFRRSKMESNHQEAITEHWVTQFLTDDSHLESMRECVKKLMYQMEEPCKTILELFYYQNHSIEMIAQAMKYQSKDVAKTQKSRCLKTLKNNILKSESHG